MSEFYTLTEYLDEPERDRVCEMCRVPYKGRLLYIAAKGKHSGKLPASYQQVSGK